MKKVSDFLFSNWTLATLLLVGSLLYAGFKIQVYDPLWQWLALALYMLAPVGVSIAAVLPASSPRRAQQFLQLGFIFFFFWVAATELIPPIIAARLSALVFRTAHYLQIGISSHWDRFYYSHLLAFSSLTGLLGGFLVNLKQKHAVAMWIWVIPAALLIRQMLALEGYSVLESRAALVTRYFFADCTTSGVDEWDVVGDCFYQSLYTAPFCAAAAFSVGAWLVRQQEWFKQKFLRSQSPEGTSEPQS